ncbi:hypothetical protein PJL18_03511 [Paenarthrobacter nicotinovorans]|nr:hypothetical protein [Paenarthrobacter nicotinovorans]
MFGGQQLLAVVFLQDVGHGDIQGNQRHVPVRGQDLGCGLGVVGDVGFGHRRDVSRCQRSAAHDGHLGNKLRQLRFQPQRFGDVGQRTDGHQPQLPGVLVGQLDQQFGSRGLHRFPVGRSQVHSADAVVAMDVRGAPMESAHLGIVRADCHGNVRVARKIQQVQGVAGAAGGTDVAAHGPDSYELGLG